MTHFQLTQKRVKEAWQQAEQKRLKELWLVPIAVEAKTKLELYLFC